MVARTSFAVGRWPAVTATAANCTALAEALRHVCSVSTWRSHSLEPVTKKAEHERRRAGEQADVQRPRVVVGERARRVEVGVAVQVRSRPAAPRRSAAACPVGTPAVPTPLRGELVDRDADHEHEPEASRSSTGSAGCRSTGAADGASPVRRRRRAAASASSAARAPRRRRPAALPPPVGARASRRLGRLVAHATRARRRSRGAARHAAARSRPPERMPTSALGQREHRRQHEQHAAQRDRQVDQRSRSRNRAAS